MMQDVTRLEISSSLDLCMKQVDKVYGINTFRSIIRLPHAKLVRLVSIRMDADSPPSLIFFLTYVDIDEKRFALDTVINTFS